MRSSFNRAGRTLRDRYDRSSWSVADESGASLVRLAGLPGPVRRFGGAVRTIGALLRPSPCPKSGLVKWSTVDREWEGRGHW